MSRYLQSRDRTASVSATRGLGAGVTKRIQAEKSQGVDIGISPLVPGTTCLVTWRSEPRPFLTIPISTPSILAHDICRGPRTL